MENQIIELYIGKEKEGTYDTLSFLVPENIETVTVSYKYPRVSGRTGKRTSDCVNVVDLGLLDAKGRFLGWSGSARDSVSVGEYASTNGYLVTPIAPGNWSIIYGAYRIPPQGLNVRYEIAFTEKAPRWLLGDLHMHSTASDGQFDVDVLAKRARGMGLDYIAVSNHNNYSENDHLPLVSGLTLIPAVEWTHYRGHMNFFGVPKPFENSFVANSLAEMQALVRAAKAQGALISVNHPKCNLCPYLWEDESCFDLVEVWNGPMRRVNEDGIRWWHALVAAGRKIPLVGGSDFHKDFHPVRLGHPVTALYAASPAAPDLLDALRGGRAYVTASVRGPRLSLRCGDASFGETVALRAGLTLEAAATNLKPGMRLQLVGPGGVIAAAFAKRGQASLSLPVPGAGFYYLIVVRTTVIGPRIQSISNPVYVEEE